MRFLVVTALLVTATSASAYGPFTHAYLAGQTLKGVSFGSEARRAYIAGAVLGEVEHLPALRRTLEAPLRREPGAFMKLRRCWGMSKDADPTLSGPRGHVSEALVGAKEPIARAFALGLRHHAAAERWAAASQHTFGDSRERAATELAYDLAHLRTDRSEASAGIETAIRFLSYEERRLVAWIGSARTDVAPETLARHLRTFRCFLGELWRDNENVVATALLRSVLDAHVRACVRAKGALAHVGCAVREPRREWSQFVGAQTARVRALALRLRKDLQESGEAPKR